MSGLNKQDLDNYITGHYGEDQFIDRYKRDSKSLINRREIVMEENIDQKYNIGASNIATGAEHSENDAMLFLAKDKVFLKKGLPAYIKGCQEAGCSKEFMKNIRALKKRMEQWQKENKELVKIPD